MELLLSELKKRDVINIVDGRCLGRIIDIQFSFPQGVIVGIVVPGRCNRGILKLFDRSRLYIPEKNIIKIGGDVILVDLKCGETCDSSSTVNNTSTLSGAKPCPPPPCHKPCPPPCKPPCPPTNKGDLSELELPSNIDLSDY